MTKIEVAKVIDHTALRPDLNRKAIDQVIKDCKQYNFGGICIDPGWIYLTKQKLPNTRIITVPNWRAGGGLEHSSHPEFSYNEAPEVDYILSIVAASLLRDRDKSKKELDEVRKIIPGIMRVIIEVTAIRAFAEKDKKDFETEVQQICQLVEQSGADWIKTDSGLFSRKDPAHLFEDIVLMKKYCKLPLKAAGGIRTLATLNKCIELGAAQIGSSNGINILGEVKE